VVKRRWIKITVAAAGVCAACGYLALPALVGRHVRSELAERGFPDASLKVASIGLHHLQLRDVHLQDGLDLGTVSFDRGVSLLWRDVDQVAITGAHVDVDAVTAHPPVVPPSKHDSGSAFKTLHVASSTIQLGSRRGQVSGTVSADKGAFDVTVAVRDPAKGGWSAKGAGRISWGKRVAVAGTMDLSIPRYEAGPVTLTQIQIPATIDGRGIRVANARAKVAGGEVTVDAFAATGKAPEVTLHVRGLRLADLLGPSKRVAGTGLIDGDVSLRVDGNGLWVERGMLAARAPGTLKVTDRAWRERIAQETGPFSLRATLAATLLDFRYDTLTAQLVAPGKTGSELRLALKGRGRTNKQELDIAIGVHGVRDASARVLGGKKR
jgi:hypothetical protein